MVTVTLKGKPFNYVDVGTGEPVVHIVGLESRWMIKGGVKDSSGIPRLAKMKSLTDKCRVLAYNNYNLSTESRVVNDPYGRMVTRPVTSDRVKQVSDDCFAFMQALNVRKAHIFAHSNVGFVGLKLALDHPEAINSIAVLEFELISASFVESKLMGLGQGLMQRAAQYAAANPEKVREILAKANYPTLTPPSGETAESLAAKYPSIITPSKDSEEFQVKMRVMGSLGVPVEEVQKSLRQPISSVVWDYSYPAFKRSSQLLKSLIPQAELFTVPKREHWYQENVNGLALGLVDFYVRHPLT